MTKKDFKERCSFHEYTGRDMTTGKKVTNLAIFFDWKDECENEGDRRGFKFGVAVLRGLHGCNKQGLFNEFYDWVTGKVQQPSWFIRYKYAADDTKRFKTPLSLTW